VPGDLVRADGRSVCRRHRGIRYPTRAQLSMSLLADRLGYARLVEPVRFRAAWERAASLRLRDGDATIADEYDQHAWINGGDPGLMIGWRGAVTEPASPLNQPASSVGL
jgi:hypothetical protein